MKRMIAGLGGCILLAVALAWGQEPDPPSRVARLSFVEGSVSFRPASVQDWGAATLNYPLSAGDHLWTAENSYAEVHIGATAIHLAPQAAFALSRLDETSAQISLSQGSAYVRIPILDDDEAVEVDTPNGAVSLSQTGSYRVDVDEEQKATFVTVRSGEASVTANGRTFNVSPGHMLQLAADREEADTQDAPPPDEWEQSCAARDDGAEKSLEASASYLAPEMDGAEDLAQYGSWSTDETFGAVWCPADVGADWAPYRNGHWAFIRPWGWTWIDDAPWGFAPFHYGRWVFVDGRWFWAPGNRETPVYSPALVVFVGGPRLHATLAGRPFAAWIPLAPGEFYRPPYPATDRYLRRVNAPAAHGAPIAAAGPATYKNRDHMVVIPQETFTAGQQVAGAVGRAPRGTDAGAAPARTGEVQTAKPIAPSTPPALVAPAEPVPPAVNPRAEQQRAEQQRAEQQRAEQQRSEQHRAEQQRAEQQRAEQQRAEQQRAEQQRAEQQRAEQQRAEEQKKAEDAKKKQ